MMRRVLVSTVACAALAVGVASDVRGHVSGLMLYGAGTATLDGVLAPGEWDRAARQTFLVPVPANDGGSAVAGTLLAMNDAATLYLALQVARPHTGTTSLGFVFDNRHDGALDLGDDSFASGPNPFFPPDFLDSFQLSAVSGARLDTDDGGTNDGAVAVSGAGSVTTIEVSHPLDSADDRHDFSLKTGDKIGFRLFLRLWSLTPACNDRPACYADRWFPGPSANDFGDLVVSPDRVPPETVIDRGPLPGARTRNRAANFAFSGADNLSPPEKLTFECSLDGAAFTRCTSPRRFPRLRLGRHTFTVRASDELANVDPAPAARWWRILPPRKRGR